MHPPDSIMRLALIGDGTVKYITSSYIAHPLSGLSYRDAAHIITKVNSNAYMIEYIKTKGILHERIPEKYLADYFEALIGIWSILNPKIAFSMVREYTLWALKHYEDSTYQELLGTPDPQHVA